MTKEKLIVIIIMGKPPALPGDSQSLTFPGIDESLPLVDRSKHTRWEALDGRTPNFKPHDMGMQIPHRLDPEVPEKGTVRGTPKTSGTRLQRTGAAKGKQNHGRAHAGGSCSCVDLNSTEVFSSASCRLHKR